MLKYQVTWDPHPVLLHLSRLYPLEGLSRFQLTMKLVTLLALITGHRLQTLTRIRLQNIVRFPDRLEIRISDRIKTSSSKSLQPFLVIPYFKDNPPLCLASVIDCYELITKDIRPSDTDYLILTVNRPIRPVSSQRLSKWIKQTTSAAFRAGISIEVIKSMAGWTQKSNMFARFYNRPLSNDPTVFAKGILSSVDSTGI
nr:unnamed protein product [Callosobruchus analis]